MTDQTRRVLTSMDRVWAIRALKMETHALEDVRAVAERWRTGLTSLTGVVAAVLAVGSPFVAGKVDYSVCLRVALVLLVLSSISSLGLGAWKAMQAAFGMPTEIENNGDALRSWSETATRSAVADLTWARRWTVAGFAFLSVTACVGLLFAQPQQTPSSSVVLDDGRQFCGHVSYESNGKRLAITAPDGSVTKTPVELLKALSNDAECK